MADYVWLLWFIPTPIFILFFYRFVENRNLFMNKDLKDVPSRHPHLIILIASKHGPRVVDEVLERINCVAQKIGMGNYRIDVVADSIDRNLKYADVTVVPPQYKTDKGTLGKARALQYMVEKRRESGDANKKTWIFHLDEESFVTDQGMISVLKYISEEANPPMSEGPIIYPNKFFEVNILCRTIECLRSYTCYERASEMTGRNSIPAHTRGSNLLVRADIEDTVGWDYSNPASEDQRFGWEIWKRYGSVFGWHGGVLEEQPPYTINEMIRQRRRWFIGNYHNLVGCSGIPAIEKVKVALRWSVLGFGFLYVSATIMVLFLGFFAILPDIPFWLEPLLIANTALCMFGFQLGLRRNIASLKLTPGRQLGVHLATLICSIPAGIITSFAVATAPFYMRDFVWRPTIKDESPSKANWIS